MSMPARLSNYLQRCGASYELHSHPHSRSSAETARTAHVKPHQLAKSVVLEDDRGCVMAVVPADAHVNVGMLARLLGRERLQLSDEQRLAELFYDCDLGAVPAIGMAWGMETVVDDELETNDEIFIEAGDHEMVLKMSRDEFRAMMADARHGHFCKPMIH